MTSLKEEAQLKKHFSSPLFIIPTRKIINGADNNNNNNILDTCGPLRPSHSLSQLPFTKHSRSASIGTSSTPRDDPAHEQQRRLCLSASDINFPRVSNELQLLDVKGRCDAELNAYLEELPSILPSSNMTEEVLQHVLILQDAVKAMISFSIDDIKHGKYMEVIQKIQKLHQFFVKSRLPHVQLITRPLLIISRVSRLAEHLGSQPEKDIDLEDEDIVEVESGHLAIQNGARVEAAQEITPPSSLQDKGTPREGKKIGLQFVNFLVDKVKKWKSRSTKTSPTNSGPNSLSTTPISTPPTPSTLQDDTLWLLCRVCEERVRSDLLEDHSRKCVAESQAELLITESDERINKLIHAVVRHNKRTNSSIALATRHTDLAALCQRAMASRDEKELDELVAVHLAALLQEDAKGTPAKAAGLEALMRRAETLFKEKKTLVAAANAVRNGPARPIKKHGIQDFEFIKPISRGAFGRVFLAKNKNTGDLYAVKVLNKRQAVQKNQVSHIKTERSIIHNTHVSK